MHAGCRILRYTVNCSRCISRWQFATASSSRDYSTNSVKTTSAPMKLDEKQIQEIREMLPIESKSIAKGLFLNKIDMNLISYPEIPDIDELVDLQDYCRQIERIFKSKADSRLTDADGFIDDELIFHLKQAGVFGLQIPVEYGGKGLDHKSYAKVCEVLSKDLSVLTTLMAHNDLCVQAILTHGTPEQKEEFLPRLASGESIGCFALHEEHSGADVAAMGSEATFSELHDDNKIKIRGQKHWVTNGEHADIMIVFAKVHSFIHEDPREVPSTAFIIDRRKTPGVQLEERVERLGVKGADIAHLKLDHVLIPSDNILGIEGEGFTVAVSTIDSNQFIWGSVAASYLRDIMDGLATYCNSTIRFDKRMSDMVMVQKRIGDLAIKAYAAESMTYYAAGLKDDLPEMDLSLEGAMIKVFARELMREGVHTAMQIAGAKSLGSGLDYERHHRDVTALGGFMRSDDFLKAYIATTGITSWVAEGGPRVPRQRSNVFQQRDPLWIRKSPIYSWSRVMIGATPFKHYINEQVHPSLEVATRYLEDALSKFDIIFADCVRFYGEDIEDEFFIQERIANMGILLFASLACISRASRAYCIGLRNADKELKYAEAFCIDARYKILHALLDLQDHDLYTLIDDRKKIVASSFFEEKGWLIESPLERSW